MDSGVLVPLYLDEVLPGDTFNMKGTFFGRLGPLVAPVMDNVYLDTFWFFVPYRLCWNNWEKFNGAQDNPGDSTDYTIPQQTPPTAGYDVGCLEDYMGIPTGIGTTTTSWTHSALPRRAYRIIYNTWFRDENLVDKVTVYLNDGPDGTSGTGTACLPRGKRHDYFTSCLPWAQKGTAVDIPLAGAVDVTPTDSEIPTFKSGGAGSAYGADLEAKTGVATPDVRVSGAGTWAALESLKWDDPNLEVDLTSVSLATINELRQAFQIQKLLERDARGGTRYIEVVKAHFGVTSPDARLQRPEYLGGGTQRINVAPIPQTSESGTTDQGTLAATATVTHNSGFVKSFTEHGIIIGIGCVRADLTYQQGLERFWSRSTRYDFYWPSLAHLGEQAVLNKEIYLQDAAADDNAFGYQERYAEYKYKPSRIAGKFRSTAAGSLDAWHLAQEFGSLPVLDDTFISEDVPLSRVLALGATQPEIMMDCYFDCVTARPMPMYSIPGFIDHF